MPSTSDLPIELLRFEASYQAKDVLLEWETAMEINNDRFEVERSVDGLDFRKIGLIQGQGTTTTSQAYSFVDEEAYFLESSVFYYRLKQVDTDGQYTYSSIKVVKITRTKRGIYLYPNPVENELTIRFSDASQEERSVSVLNSLGQVLLYFDEIPSQFETTFDLGELPSGNYWVKVMERMEVTTRMVQKY